VLWIRQQWLQRSFDFMTTRQISVVGATSAVSVALFLVVSRLIILRIEHPEARRLLLRVATLALAWAGAWVIGREFQPRWGRAAAIFWVASLILHHFAGVSASIAWYGIGP
jgi:hypothetical protein